MNSSRLEEIEALAEYIATLYKSDGPIQLLDILEQNQITCSFGDYGDAFDGLLEVDADEFHVYINTQRVGNETQRRCRFTIAHELGHYYIDEHRNALLQGFPPHGSTFTNFSSPFLIEQEADAFAASLLMPRAHFVKAARKLTPATSSLESLANRFGSSLTATAIRYAKTHEDTVAVMFWTIESRQWCWSSPSLEQKTGNVTYKATSRITGSATAELLLENPALDRIGPRGSTLAFWFTRIGTGTWNDHVMVEEAMRLGRFGVLTLLYPE